MMFEDMHIKVPSGTGPKAEHAEWVLSGTVENRHHRSGPQPKLRLVGRLNGYLDGRPVSLVAQNRDLTLSVDKFSSLLTLRRNWQSVSPFLGVIGLGGPSAPVAIGAVGTRVGVSQTELTYSPDLELNKELAMLTVGNKLPQFCVQACVGCTADDLCEITDETYAASGWCCCSIPRTSRSFADGTCGLR